MVYLTDTECTAFMRLSVDAYRVGDMALGHAAYDAAAAGECDGMTHYRLTRECETREVL